MTGDARGEAERIVDTVCGKVARGAMGAMSESEGDAAVDYIDRVKAALAAAIEETDAEDAVERLRNSPRRHGKGAATTRLSNARAARRDALSALRARAGEET